MLDDRTPEDQHIDPGISAQRGGGVQPWGTAAIKAAPHYNERKGSQCVMANEGPKLHPHIFAPAAASSKDFTSPKSGRGNLTLPQRTRGQHANHLLAQLHNTEPLAAARAEEQKSEGLDEGNGIYLVFKSTPGFDLKFESLDVANSGIELCTVRKTGDGQTEATVYVPDGKLTYFLNKITAYRDEDGKPSKKTGLTKPKNQDLVSSIGDIQLAALQSLWTDLPELFPAPQHEVTWEVWLRRTTGVDHVTRLRQHAERYGLTVSQQEIVFIGWLLDAGFMESVV